MKIETIHTTVEVETLETIEPGMVYTITEPVNTMTILKIPKDPIESRVIFTTGDQTPNISFPNGTVFVSEAPSFVPKTSYILILSYGKVSVIRR
jgi:hypothetical protein